MLYSQKIDLITNEIIESNPIHYISANIKDNNLKFDIEVDGGINFSNFKSVIDAGANVLVSGTTIFKENDGDIKKNIDFLKSI